MDISIAIEHYQYTLEIIQQVMSAPSKYIERKGRGHKLPPATSNRIQHSTIYHRYCTSIISTVVYILLYIIIYVHNIRVSPQHVDNLFPNWNKCRVCAQSHGVQTELLQVPLSAS